LAANQKKSKDLDNTGTDRERIILFLKDLFSRDDWQRVWLVGGIVRDFILGRASRDIDLATTVPSSTLELLGFRLVEGKSTLPIHFKADPEYGIIEVVSLVDAGDLMEDLHRRDFTINALALPLAGELIDPLGGREHMEQGVLRACSARAFRDDPLRIFRAFRFETEGWRLAPESAVLIRKESWEESWSGIPVERFSREMLKALDGTSPERFFLRMVEFEVGSVYLPELFRMPRIPAGPLDKHPEGDLLTHSCQVLTRVAVRSDDPLARFCAFFHDLGKLATDPAHHPKHHGHDDAGFALAKAFCDRLRISADHRTALMWVSLLHGSANRWAELRDSTKLKMADQARRGGIVKVLPLVSAADKPDGSGMPGWECAVQVAGMNTMELGIDPRKLEDMPVELRSGFILQERVKRFREIRPTVPLS
jgi:tRNA nucleotidyltransferase (CCA-adding enzyme)